MLINVTSVPEINNSTSVLPPDNTITDNHTNTVRFLIIPVCALLIVVLLTVLVLLFLRKKRLDRLRHHLMPFYNFDPGEEEDWQTELLEDARDLHSLKVYKSMDYETTSLHNQPYLSSKLQ